ncbi:MAG TPA: 4Fe-4S binding protein [Anaerolineales bacterium]|nr:4Fe-4S binding protein [Anaerolineales bacterium]
MNRINLTASPIVRGLLRNRIPQLGIITVLLAGYLFAILAGLIGSPVGSSNFAIVFVWIAWWALLILIAVPLLGRGWCSVCPIPVPGDWLQRGAVLGPGGSRSTRRGLRWPRLLRNIWLQSGAFMVLAAFSTVLLTSPLVTAIVLAAMLLGAIGLSLVFERRAFCRYVCPVGGFIGLYAQVAPLELRIQNKSVCVTCIGKPCYNGSAAGYGCPWDVFPAGLSKNTYCGLCMECLRTCPHENISLNLRPFAADLLQPAARMDEAFKGFVMLGSAMVYSAVLLGPWGFLKDAAYRVGSTAWFGYVLGVLAIIGIVLPGLFALCVASARSAGSFRVRFARMSTSLIPLGLTAWIAFSLSFVMSNASYVLSSISDPLNLGWDLLGTAHLAWQPVLTAGVAPLQSLVLAAGAWWAARQAQSAAAQERISPLPVMLYIIAAASVFMWLLL